jgi:hypothetical protein
LSSSSSRMHSDFQWFSNSQSVAELNYPGLVLAHSSPARHDVITGVLHKCNINIYEAVFISCMKEVFPQS